MSLPHVALLAQKLIQVPSVTPDDCGAIDALIEILQPLGFTCEKLSFTGNGGPDTQNLWAIRHGKGSGPHFCFAGHTDVVPAGNATMWRHDPFSGVIADGILYGRGAVDMKGAIAAFIAAVAQMDNHNGAISLLITGNEEGVTINGTPRVLEWLENNQIQISHCLVGEPTSENRIGDILKNGRRGSFSADLTVHGIQGHVAYPQRALNPNHLLGQIAAQLTAEPLDAGNESFPPSTLQITNLQTLGETAVNLVPASAKASMNIRYNTTTSAEKLERWIRDICDKVINAYPEARYELIARDSSQAFLTPVDDFICLVRDAVSLETKLPADLSTSGGTSDARYIKAICPVIELGLKNATAHQVDEHVAVDDLIQLTAIYLKILRSYFAS